MISLSGGGESEVSVSFGCRLLCAVFLALFSSTLARPTAQSSNDQVVWFVLLEEPRGRLSIDPLGKVSAGKVSSVPSGCDAEDPSYKDFEASYLKQGKSYQVTFGGSPAGVISLQTPDQSFGNFTLTYNGPANVKGRVMALATNATLAAKGSPARKAPTPDERRQALALASQRFTESGISSESLSNMRVENLTHTTLKTSQSPVLIGSFTAGAPDRMGPIHGLFLVASERNGELSPELVWMHLALSDTDSETLSLVDHADLFGDGQDEIVAMLGFYENYRYRVYRRSSNAHWEPVFETDTLGCL
jgi:hypothetical protein